MIEPILRKAVEQKASDILIIAGLPVAVNICCHAYRHSTVTL